MLLDGLLVTEDGRLVVHDSVHVGPECIHILVVEDPVLLGLILVASNRVVRSYTWSSNVLELEMDVVVGVGWRAAWLLPRCLLGSQT